MEQLPFFTHVPKTAGTAVRKKLLYPNIPPGKRGQSRGFKELISTNWAGCRWLEGHFPYGIHRYMRGLEGTPVYFTMLRKPIEQAISYYYFIHFCSRKPDSSYEHPLYSEVQKYDLLEFYFQPQHRNIQTRFIGGYLWHRLRDSPLLSPLDGWLLQTAKRHLREQYACYGLVSRFDQSMEMFGELFGWKVDLPESRVKPTRDRPTAEDLSNSTLAKLRDNMSLDVELHRYAVQHFEDQAQFEDLFAHSV
jgi:hypothetical protein